MEIYMDINWIRGHLNYGHFEGDVDFSKEEEKDFQMLLAKDLNDEELTKEEQDRLEDYKETIIDSSHIVIDDYEIDDSGEYEWEDLLE